MKGTMMQFPLTLRPLLERAAKLFPNVEIVSSRPDNSIHRYTHGEMSQRARSLAAVLQAAGLEPGDRVASLMWNHYAHLEAYFGVPCAGGVLHTLNLRLHPDELAYIINHAQDRFLIVDDVLLHLFEKFKDKVKFERVFVVPFCGEAVPAAFENYETLLRDNLSTPVYPDLEEDDAAAMCYTSGTTGKPKGVAYSHRALVLHSYSISLPDNFSLSRHDCILPAMSMFHANAWGLPHAAVMNGSRLVLPGPNLQPERLLDLLSREDVTFTGAVPTVWLAVLDTLERQPGRWKLTPGMRVVVAGSAAPETLFRRFEKFGVRVIQPWGMTETTPIATVCTLKPEMQNWPKDRQFELRAKQGLPSPFVEIRAVGDRGEVPWDGENCGRTGNPRPVRRRQLLQPAARMRPLDERRLVSQRRYRYHRRRRLHEDHRPHERPNQVRRGMDQLRGCRECSRSPPGREGSSGGCRPASQVAGKTARGSRP